MKDKSEDNKIILNKVLHNIDVFVEPQLKGDSELDGLLDISPFKSGRLRAKVANKIVKLPLKIINKSGNEYFLQQDVDNIKTENEIASLRSELEALRREISNKGK